MFVFGDVAPPSPKWWAPWVYTIVFAAFAGFLTYGSMTYGGPPLDRARSTGEGWALIAILWFFVAVRLVQAVIVTARHLRRRG
jgi:TRAP-type C4-dicarboxylate transport system permease small subunit